MEFIQVLKQVSMTDQKLWELAQRIAKQNYEQEYGPNSWEEHADKYEREDYVWYEYEKIKREIERL